MCSKPELTHQWERLGYKAPYRIVGSHEAKFQACPGAPVQPAGTCDVCGNGIMLVVRVRDANGVEFNVGCDCAMKVYTRVSGGRRITEKNPFTREIQDIRRKHQREVREARELSNIATGRELIETPGNVARLKSLAHESKYWAEQGQSRWDQYEWFIKNAGRKGKLDQIKLVARILGVDLPFVRRPK